MTSLKDYLAKLPVSDQEMVKARAAEIVAEQMRLSELRAEMGLSQSDMAKSLGVKQPRISKIERQSDLSLSVLREYVGKLGGRVEVVATFGNGRRVRIETAADIERVEDVSDEPKTVSHPRRYVAPRRRLGSQLER